jgi:hypothetical protein
MVRENSLTMPKKAYEDAEKKLQEEAGQKLIQSYLTRMFTRPKQCFLWSALLAALD